MGGELRRLLLEHMARTGRRGGDLVFGRTARDPFTPTWVRKRALGCWAAVVGSFLTGTKLPVEIDLIGLHECRHTYVSLMHAAGRSLEEIGDYVGPLELVHDRQVSAPDRGAARGGGGRLRCVPRERDWYAHWYAGARAGGRAAW